MAEFGESSTYEPVNSQVGIHWQGKWQPTVARFWREAWLQPDSLTMKAGCMSSWALFPRACCHINHWIELILLQKNLQPWKLLDTFFATNSMITVQPAYRCPKNWLMSHIFTCHVTGMTSLTITQEGKKWHGLYYAWHIGIDGLHSAFIANSYLRAIVLLLDITNNLFVVFAGKMLMPFEQNNVIKFA